MRTRAEPQPTRRRAGRLFVPNYSASSEGIVPVETSPLRLAPAGTGKAEHVIMLSCPWAMEAAVHDVERF